MGEEAVDHMARQSAALALQAHADHEANCDKRWSAHMEVFKAFQVLVQGNFASANEGRRALHSQLNALVWSMLMGALAAIATCGSLIWYLATHALYVLR